MKQEDARAGERQLLAQVNEDEVIQIVRRLVQIQSVNPPGNECAAAVYAAETLTSMGLACELIPHGDPARASLLARIRGSGEAPNLLLAAHLDVVPPGEQTWRYEPFSATVAEGKVWGRGTSDMKGGLACMMAAAGLLARAGVPLKGDLILAATAGEEVDSLGAFAVAERSDILPLQAVIVTEPSANDVYVAEKGALWLELTTYGQTAHGSMPHLGRNAVMMMVELLAEADRLAIPFDEHPSLGGFSQSINTVAGGVKTNVVPDRCTATIDMRTVPGQQHAAIVRQYEDLIAGLSARIPGFRAGIKIVNDRPPVTTPADERAVQAFVDVVEEVTGSRPTPKGVRYYTDAAVYVPRWNVPMVICGPGQAGMAHQPDEFVEIERLVENTRILALAALRFLT